MDKFIIASALLGALVAVPATAQEQDSQEQFVKVWETDFSGKPPFKRVMKLVPVADIAALEVESEPVETELVRVIDFTGKPPFKRKLKEVPIVDAASLEIVDAEETESKSPLRRKAGFKRHR